MYELLSLLSGAFIATLIAANGMLSDLYGIYLGAVIIHVVGVAFSLAMMGVLKKGIHLDQRLPWCYFCGGAIGVIATIANNFAFGKIPITNIVALGLFAQLVTSLLIDNFGLFGMKLHRTTKYSLIGVAFALVGIACMLDFTNTKAVLSIMLSLIAGACVVIVRTFNSKLAVHIGDLQSSFVNHLVGLPITILALFILGQADLAGFHGFIPANPFVYIGGACGVMVVLVFNIVVPKVSAFYITLLSFVGQIFTGLALDLILKNPWDRATLTGAVLVAFGILISNIATYLHSQKLKRA